jgi:hypothetical protein
MESKNMNYLKTLIVAVAVTSAILPVAGQAVAATDDDQISYCAKIKKPPTASWRCGKNPPPIRQ